MLIQKKPLLAVVALCLGITQQALAQDDPLSIAFVYDSAIENNSWTGQHDSGRQAVEAHFGDRVTTQYVENVEPGPDAASTMQDLANSGVDMIFATSVAFSDTTISVAAQFPDVFFENANGDTTADNVATYAARDYQGMTIEGHIAGQLTATNEIGIVAPFPIPVVMRNINAFAIEMRRVNPNANLNVAWINRWNDPPAATEAANTLVDNGADILVQFSDSPAVLQVAQERGILGFGLSSDMLSFAPDAQLTAVVNNYGPYYISRVQAALDRTWQSTATWDGLGTDMVTMADYTNMPDDVANSARALEQALASGQRRSFQGPISAQSGSEIVAEGQVLGDESLLTMDFFVEGVIGAAPN